jgi:hypothetical protein
MMRLTSDDCLRTFHNFTMDFDGYGDNYNFIQTSRSNHDIICNRVRFTGNQSSGGQRSTGGDWSFSACIRDNNAGYGFYADAQSASSTYWRNCRRYKNSSHGFNTSRDD